MKYAALILTIFGLALLGMATGCRDSGEQRPKPTAPKAYHPQAPASVDVTVAADAFLDACDQAQIPVREMLVSTPSLPPLTDLLGHPVHPSVHSWFVWMDGLRLPENPRRIVELPAGGAFLSRKGVMDLVRRGGREKLGAEGFPGSLLVPIGATLTVVSVECDPHSPRYGAVVVSSERGWNGAQFFPSLESYLNFLRACVQEEAIVWSEQHEMLLIDYQKIETIEEELGVVGSLPEDSMEE
ncbi:MAG: hypothetical protein ACAI34_16440 [Verrucomicrobium sp.]|nr:hypothetical protein [Verrucomicrobium sp.]